MAAIGGSQDGLVRGRSIAFLATLGIAALVVAFILVPAAFGRGQGLALALTLGVAGLLAVLVALAAALPPGARSAVGWVLFATCPVVLLAWIGLAGLPAGAGLVILGVALGATALAGLVIAVREAL